MALINDRRLWPTPPADALFLHRKVGGLYLLAARLQARVNVRELVRAVVRIPAVAPWRAARSADPEGYRRRLPGSASGASVRGVAA